MSIDVDIEKRLGDFRLRAQFQAGNETLALLGASGCGKSMTLKCIAGIEKPDRGRIAVDGRILFDSEKKIDLPPQKRFAGLLFQNYALFPNMTVEQNIFAGASRQNTRNMRRAAADRVIDRFGLSGLRSHYPHQLSGGQQQRTALARLLVSEPNILLLDEPFSALDSHLRFQIESEMRQTIREFGKTVILVSHDRDEVFRMADSIAIMEGGCISTIGAKDCVFADPKTIAGARLTGCKNISRVIATDDTHVCALDWGITLGLDRPCGHAAAIGVRMHDIRIGAGENTVCCHVAEEIENPFSYTIMVKPLGSDSTTAIGVQVGKAFWDSCRAARLDISIPAAAVLILESERDEQQ